MREIVVIGVGAGDPEQVTMQAASALNRVDVFFVLDKGEVKQEGLLTRGSRIRAGTQETIGWSSAGIPSVIGQQDD